MSKSGWNFAFVLPNLELPKHDAYSSGPDEGDWSAGITMGSQYISIVPNDDPRLSAARVASRELRKLLESFRTVEGQAYRPAVMILREDAPPSVRSMECVVGFRNAVAFTFVLEARAAITGGTSHAEPAWVDTFDLHPTVLSERQMLVTLSPALTSLFAPDVPYLATHSADISPCGRMLRADAYLHRALSEMWVRRYIDGEHSASTAALFRALEVAFLAASVANRNQGSVFEYGTQLALWVSALEILCRPRASHVGLASVIKLLGTFEWASEELRAKRHECERNGKRMSLNSVQYAYALMYKARNAFLHGEPVTAETLSPMGLTGATSLPWIASTVFRTGLAACLATSVTPRPPDCGQQIDDMLSQDHYERALTAAFATEAGSPKGSESS